MPRTAQRRPLIYRLEGPSLDRASRRDQRANPFIPGVRIQAAGDALGKGIGVTRAFVGRDAPARHAALSVDAQSDDGLRRAQGLEWLAQLHPWIGA